MKKSFNYLNLTIQYIFKSFNYSHSSFLNPLQFFSLLNVDVSSALHISEIATSVPSNEVICSLFLLVVPPFIYHRSMLVLWAIFHPKIYIYFLDCGLHSSFVGNTFLYLATQKYMGNAFDHPEYFESVQWCLWYLQIPSFCHCKFYKPRYC